MSVAVVLRKKRLADGSYPLAIRVTLSRKSSYQNLGKSIREEEWDADARRVRKSHPNSVQLNNFLLKKLSEASDREIELVKEKEGVSAKSVKRSLKRKANITFSELARERLDQLKARGKFTVEQAERSKLKVFQLFLKQDRQEDDIAFSDIDNSLLLRFKAWLVGSRNLSERSVASYMLFIRSIYGIARKDTPALAKCYPFGKDGFAIPVPESMKIGLSVEEVKRIEALELPKGSYLDHTRNVWLLSFYFAGVRSTDTLLLKWTDFKDGRLHYRMGKNQKPGSVKISTRAGAVLDHYLPLKDKTGYVFPDVRTAKDLSDAYELQRRCRSVNRKLNLHLKNIAKLAEIEVPLSMHISRHSFANISGDKVQPQLLQKLYRHSSIKTTIGYQASFIHKNADDAMDAVLEF